MLSNCLQQRIAVISSLLRAGKRVYFRRDGDRYCWSLYENFQCEYCLFVAHSNREFAQLKAEVERKLAIARKPKRMPVQAPMPAAELGPPIMILGESFEATQ